MKAKGVPFCYRCRVVPDQEVVIPDLIRGDVTFNTSTLGDFVILRSNGLPVYVRAPPLRSVWLCCCSWRRQ